MYVEQVRWDVGPVLMDELALFAADGGRTLPKGRPAEAGGSQLLDGHRKQVLPAFKSGQAGLVGRMHGLAGDRYEAEDQERLRWFESERAGKYEGLKVRGLEGAWD